MGKVPRPYLVTEYHKVNQSGILYCSVCCVQKYTNFRNWTRNYKAMAKKRMLKYNMGAEATFVAIMVLKNLIDSHEIHAIYIVRC